MEGTIQALKLDMLGGPKKEPMLRAKQGDTNSRWARLELYTGGTPYLLPDDCEICLWVKKPDGKKTFSQCEQKDTNLVLAPLKEQTLAVSGLATCELYIQAADGGIKSQTFYLQIDQSVMDEEAIESTNEFNGLTAALAETLGIRAELGAALDLVIEVTAAAEEATQKAIDAADSVHVAVDAAGRAEADRAKAEAARDRVELLEQSFDGYGKLTTDRNYANAIVGTASGTGCVLTPDAWDAPVRELAVYGRSEQDTTTGAQLLDVSNHSLMNDGTLVTRDLGYTIVVTGKGAYSGAVFYLPTAGGKTITFGYDTRTALTGSNIQVAYYLPDETIVYGKGTEPTSTIPPDATKITLRIVVNNTATALDSVGTVTVTGLRVNIGSTVLPWEPYTGGQASPNPFYPQEIRSVENPVVVGSVGVRNLIKDTNFDKITDYNYWSRTTQSATKWKIADEAIQGNKVMCIDLLDITYDGLSEDARQSIPYKNLELNVPYTISFWLKVVSGNPTANFKWYLTNITGTSTDNGWNPVDASTDWIKVSKTITFTVKQNGLEPIMYFRCYNASAAYISMPKFEKASAPTPWTPAPEDITDDNRADLLPYISTAALTGYTLRGVGDVRDRLECRDGVWGINAPFFEYVLDGSSNIQRALTSTEGHYRWYITLGNVKAADNDDTSVIKGYSESLPPTTASRIYWRNNGFSSIMNGTGFYFYADAWKEWTLEQMKAYLKDNPIKFVLPCAAPAWTPLPDTLQQQLNALRSYSGDQACMYVVSDVAPDVEVEYVKDSNKALQQIQLDAAEQITELQAQIDQLIITNNLSR